MPADALPVPDFPWPMVFPDLSVSEVVATLRPGSWILLLSPVRGTAFALAPPLVALGDLAGDRSMGLPLGKAGADGAMEERHLHAVPVVEISGLSAAARLREMPLPGGRPMPLRYGGLVPSPCGRGLG